MMRILMLILTAASLTAHEVSESFLRIEAGDRMLKGNWEVSLRDLEVAVGVDENRDDVVTWGEVLALKPRLEKLLQRALVFPNTKGTSQLKEFNITKKVGGTFLTMNFTVD